VEVSADGDVEVYAQFGEELEEIRQMLRIPGMSAAIVKDDQMVWARGFGYADVADQILATPDTPFHLASLTKPFAAVVVMQLVEEGLIDLDDPIAEYGIDLESSGVIRVRHLLSHTSEGEPGAEFIYNGWRYYFLDPIIQSVTGKSFREFLAERVLTPLEMDNTAPNPMSQGEGFLTSFAIWLNPQNRRVFGQLASPYRIDSSYNVVDAQYEQFFMPGAGLISTATDMARFYIALDQNLLISEETKEMMFAPTVSTSGNELPHGLGFFTQTHDNVRLIWHYGWWPPCASAFVIHAPEEHLTFIILATTDNLSRPYQLGSGNFLPLDSAVGLAFYRTFIYEPKYRTSVPRVDWDADAETIMATLREPINPGVQKLLERELISRRRLYDSMGRSDLSDKLSAIHSQVYAPSQLENHPSLQSVGNPPSEFVTPITMHHRLAILLFVLLLILLPGLWWVIRRRRRRDVR
jgi:CubicO group peptidase (beta-lactamase class C family)